MAQHTNEIPWLSKLFSESRGKSITFVLWYFLQLSFKIVKYCSEQTVKTIMKK